MLSDIFHNYETVKLHIAHPDLVNILILLVLGFLIYFQGRRYPDVCLLDQRHTEQLRGIAILFIVVGHLWVHVNGKLPDMVFGGDAVALFLILSGYGLTISHRIHSPTLKSFLSHRVRRVMIPYWIITIGLIFLDYILLKRSYDIKDILLTMLGINISPATHYIDYTRWYITFLLFWYAVFYLVITTIKKPLYLFVLFTVSLALFPLNYYITHLGWYQIFAFPLGCLIGYYRDGLMSLFLRRRYEISSLALSAAFFVIVYKVWLYDLIRPHVYSVILAAINEFISIILCLSLIILTGLIHIWGYGSRLLSLCGKASYELFLLHGPFLIKYNPIITQGNPLGMGALFLLYLVAVTTLSYFVHIFIGRLSMK
jgi:peptidoglycan/LPS O-acetylase OafA/YrhL